MEQLDKNLSRIRNTLDELIYTDFIPMELKKEEINYDAGLIRAIPLVLVGGISYLHYLNNFHPASLILPAYFYFETTYPIIHNAIHTTLSKDEKNISSFANKDPALSFIELGYYFYKKLLGR